jgi:hypothetical protein
MVISPTPPWAILFFAIHDHYSVEKWKEFLILLEVMIH